MTERHYDWKRRDPGANLPLCVMILPIAAHTEILSRPGMGVGHVLRSSSVSNIWNKHKMYFPFPGRWFLVPTRTILRNNRSALDDMGDDVAWETVTSVASAMTPLMPPPSFHTTQRGVSLIKASKNENRLAAQFTNLQCYQITRRCVFSPSP